MVFDPLYATRPDLRRIGTSLQSPVVGDVTQASPPSATTVTPGPTALTFAPSLSDRVTGAVGSFGAQLDPASTYEPEAFFGAAARGFTGVRSYFQNLAGQQVLARERQEDRDLERRRVEAEIRARETPGQTNAPRIGQAEWVQDPNDATREIRGYTDPRSGQFVPQEYDGVILSRPKPVREPAQRNIDPLSPEGIAASGRRAKVVAEAAESGASSAQQQSFAGYDALLEAADNVERLLTQRPQGVGLAYGAPEAVTQRLDPEGVPLRAAIADVRSILLFARSGGAVSEGEAERIAPLLPKPSDTAETIKRKLPELRKAVIRLRDALQGQLGRRSGVAPSEIP